MMREHVFKTALKLGVLGAVLLAVQILPWLFQLPYSQSYPLQTMAPTATSGPYPPAPTRSLPARTETPGPYQPQPGPTGPPIPYPSRPTPASSYTSAGTAWAAIQLGSIVIAALGIAGVAVIVRFYRRRR